MKQQKSTLIKVIAICLILSLLAPLPVAAAEDEHIMPLASYYLDAYSAYVYNPGSGQVQVWFDVMGVGNMDEIGVLSIKLYESTDKVTWTRVKTFSHDDYASMLAYNDYYHSSHVTYQGIAGRYYKAYICFWAGKDGSGDTRYMWTSAK